MGRFLVRHPLIFAIWMMVIAVLNIGSIVIMPEWWMRLLFVPSICYFSYYTWQGFCDWRKS